MEVRQCMVENALIWDCAAKLYMETTSQIHSGGAFIFNSDYQVSSYLSFSKLCCVTFSLFMIHALNTHIKTISGTSNHDLSSKCHTVTLLL